MQTDDFSSIRQALLETGVSAYASNSINTVRIILLSSLSLFLFFISIAPAMVKVDSVRGKMSTFNSAATVTRFEGRWVAGASVYSSNVTATTLCHPDIYGLTTIAHSVFGPSRISAPQCPTLPCQAYCHPLRSTYRKMLLAPGVIGPGCWNAINAQ